MKVQTTSGIVEVPDVAPYVVPLEETERNWRTQELTDTVDTYQQYVTIWHGLTTAEKDAVAGYAQLLRDWPQHVDFPDSTKRPQKPTGYPI